MNGEYIQNFREKLRTRVEKLASTGYPIFHSSLRQFWGFLQKYPIFIDILEYLEKHNPLLESEADKIIKESQAIVYNEELENVAISYFVIKKCIESEDQEVEFRIGFTYSGEGEYDSSLKQFKSLFLDPLYHYLDEQLEDQRVILALLRRYKHKCEWFQREHLFDLWESNTQKGEKNLSMHLYEWLYDQGLDFVIEPSSASGEADLIAAQQSKNPLVADVKIFNPDKGRGIQYIAQGFNQIYLYTQDYNEAFGYLIIFNTSGKDLKFAVANQTQGIPSVTHNNKTLFILTIDIFPHEASASKRGLLET